MDAERRLEGRKERRKEGGKEGCGSLESRFGGVNLA